MSRFAGPDEEEDEPRRCRRHVFMRDPASGLTLAQELGHVRQQAEYPFGFWVSYLLLPETLPFCSRSP